MTAQLARTTKRHTNAAVRSGFQAKEIAISESEERLNQWLSDAHAMEEQAETMLSGMSSRIENYPDLAARIQQHLEEIRLQRQRLEACMQRRGVSTSTMKDMTARRILG